MVRVRISEVESLSVTDGKKNPVLFHTKQLTLGLIKDRWQGFTIA